MSIKVPGQASPTNFTRLRLPWVLLALLSLLCLYLCWSNFRLAKQTYELKQMLQKLKNEAIDMNVLQSVKEELREKTWKYRALEDRVRQLEEENLDIRKLQESSKCGFSVEDVLPVAKEIISSATEKLSGATKQISENVKQINNEYKIWEKTQTLKSKLNEGNKLLQEKIVEGGAYLKQKLRESGEALKQNSAETMRVIQEATSQGSGLIYAKSREGADYLKAKAEETRDSLKYSFQRSYEQLKAKWSSWF